MNNFIDHALKGNTPHDKIVEHLIFHYHGNFPTREAATAYLRDYVERSAPKPNHAKAKG